MSQAAQSTQHHLEEQSQYVLEHVLRWLKPSVVPCLMLTCRRLFRLISSNDEMWHHWCFSHWPRLLAQFSSEILPRFLPDDCSFKWLFFCLLKEYPDSLSFSGSATFIDDGRFYIGEWKEGKYDGKGILVNKGPDSMYSGEWKTGKACGKGYYISSEFKRSGQWLHDTLHGFGTEVYLKKCHGKDEKYEGEFQNGHRSGYGIYFYWNGDRYEGNWISESKYGSGKYIWSSGAQFIGTFVGNDREGKGTFIWPNGDRVEGDWKEDLPTEPEKWQHENIKKAIELNRCTGCVEGLRTNRGQLYYRCQTCAVRVCEVCLRNCHSSHPVSAPSWSSLNNCLCCCPKSSLFTEIEASAS